MRVLVVEDDARIADGLKAHLALQGHAVDSAASIAQAWAMLCAEPFELLLLDLGLPDGDGADLLRRLRAARVGQLPDPQLPVLVMTARDAVASRITALDLGADDYLCKPFDPDELSARMRALRRRWAGRGQPLLTLGPLQIDPASRQLRRDGVLVPLPARAFALLLVLMEARPQVLSRQQLEQRLYNWDQALDSNAIEVHIHHLRKKLGDGLIRTVRGVGYFIPEDPPP